MPDWEFNIKMHQFQHQIRKKIHFIIHDYTPLPPKRIAKMGGGGIWRKIWKSYRKIKELHYDKMSLCFIKLIKSSIACQPRAT